MTTERRPNARMQLPLRPGRPALSKRVRLVLLLVLVGAVVAVAVVGIVLARSGRTPLRVVTIPVADRAASPALLRAAARVGFHPLRADGAGEIESKPASAARPPISSTLLQVGAAAPPFTLRTPTGRRVSLTALRGRAVLLEFFTTWCPHCAAEAPHLQRLFTSLPRPHVAFVAVDANSEDAASVLAYHIYFGLGFPAVLDPGPKTVTFPKHGHSGPVTRSYGVGAYPTFYVLDRTGRVAWRGDGEQPDALLRRELLRAIR